MLRCMLDSEYKTDTKIHQGEGENNNNYSRMWQVRKYTMSYQKQEQNLFDQSLIISNKKYLNTEKISNLVKNHYVVFYLKAGVFFLAAAPPPPRGPLLGLCTCRNGKNKRVMFRFLRTCMPQRFKFPLKNIFFFKKRGEISFLTDRQHFFQWVEKY